MTALTSKAGKVKTSYQNIAFFMEDLISWRNIDWRLGLRLERDDYLKNTNLAPRLVTRWKPFDDTALSLGLNRYYGRSFSSLKLTEKILALNESPTGRYRNLDNLKTPYSDELSLGVNQNIGNLAFKLSYIHRKNKDRITLLEEQIGTSPSGAPVYERYYGNGNNYSVNVYTFEVSNIQPWQLGNSYWNSTLAFDWLNTKRADIPNPQSQVYLDGELMTRQQMENKVNASTENWIIRLGLDMAIPQYNINWSNNLYIKAPIRGARELTNQINDLDSYERYDYGRHTQWDTSIRWQPNIMGKHKPYVKIDILNVLNQIRKSRTYAINNTDEYGIYTPGREFWLEVGYEF